ncbi:hypothetical protein DPX16_21350 [Anabarilius grahami]|uniref:Retrotransposon gag domain-containing protein n=1 Tax=Anabarilius grahami TaxID=495550 RepID=A0A3N0XES6_ANAGA|nr:hypothetical protein DPX16_21350 [Anabarilius grahami]
MGILLVPVPPKSHQQKPHVSAEDRLWTFRKDGRPLERYVEEFSELVYLLNWPDAPINACFLMGLDKDMIRYSEPACFFSLVESLNLILFLNGSEFKIEEVQKRAYCPCPVPSEKHAAWSVQQPPVSSTYPSSGYSPVVLPGSESKPRRRATAKPRRPRKMAAAAPAFHEPPKEAEWLMDFWAEPAVPASHEPALILLEPDPILHGPAPAPHEPALILLEPDPILHGPAPAFHEPAPALHEPAPALQHEPAHESLPSTREFPKNFVFGGGACTHGWGTHGLLRLQTLHGLLRLLTHHGCLNSRTPPGDLRSSPLLSLHLREVSRAPTPPPRLFHLWREATPTGRGSTHPLHLDFIICTPFIMDSLPSLLEQPELFPPPAMKSNQEAEQSPMDLTSLFNYSAVSQQQLASLSLSTLQEKDMLQYDSNTENHSC